MVQGSKQITRLPNVDFPISDEQKHALRLMLVERREA